MGLDSPGLFRRVTNDGLIIIIILIGMIISLLT